MGTCCGSAYNKGKETLLSILYDEVKYSSYSDTAFDKIDIDKNGYIEVYELTQLIQEFVNKIKKDVVIPEDKVKSALQYLDADGDGKLSKEEFRNQSRFKLLSFVRKEQNMEKNNSQI